MAILDLLNYLSTLRKSSFVLLNRKAPHIYGLFYITMFTMNIPRGPATLKFCQTGTVSLLYGNTLSEKLNSFFKASGMEWLTPYSLVLLIN